MKVSRMRRKGLGQHVARQISRWETLGLEALTVPATAAAREGKRGPLPGRAGGSGLKGPPAEEGAWELGPGLHPGDLEAGPDSGGHLGRGRGLPLGPWDPGQGAEVLHRPAGPAQASPLLPSSTPAIPGPTAFAAARAFGSTASGRAGPAPAPGEARLWAPRDKIRTRRLRSGPDRAASRGRCGACGHHKAARMETPGRGSGRGRRGRERDSKSGASEGLSLGSSGAV